MNTKRGELAAKLRQWLLLACLMPVALYAAETATFNVKLAGAGNPGGYYAFSLFGNSYQQGQGYSTCINPAYFMNNQANMVPEQPYYGMIVRNPALTYCYIALHNTTVPGCSGLYLEDLSVGGNPTNIPFTVTLRPQARHFTWDFPKDGIQALRADGQSSVRGSVIGNPGALTWSFDGPALGCKLVGSSTGVTVTAGTNTGTVYVKATKNAGGTCMRVPLDLVDCESDCATGDCGGSGVSANNGSVDVKIGLGWALYGNTAGYLHVKAASPTNTTASPSGLQYNFRRPEVEVYTNILGLFQIKAPRVFVNVVTNSGSQYCVQLFHVTNVVSFTNGGYQLTNGPYRSVTIEHVGGDTNHVRVTDSIDSAIHDYTWQTNGWLLVTGGGLRSELKMNVYSETNTVRTTTTSISDGVNPGVYTKVETYRTYSYGERLIQEVIGSGAAARTNAYSFTTNGYPEQSIWWDGSWEYRFYDANNRPIKFYSSFGNQSVTTNNSLCRLVEYDYSTNVISGSGDTGKSYFNTPRRTIEYLQNVEVARSYFIGLTNLHAEIRCVAPGANWDDSRNLATTNIVQTNGFRFNEPWIIQRPDGTAEIFRYGVIGDAVTNLVLTGHLDATGTNIDAGTLMTSVLSPTGLLLSNVVTDVESGIVLRAETYQYDSLNRLTNTTYLDGTSSSATYGCCTVESEKDRDGTVTTYGYDSLKRRLTITRNGITVSNVYDPAGNILGTVRYGTDASPIAINQTAYNDGGEITSTTNALNAPTLYTNYFDGSGQRISRTTYADGGTRIETYYRDGSLESVTGTAVFPVRYEYGVEQDGGVYRAYTKEIKLDANGSDTSEWTKTYADTAGRAYKTVYAAASGTPFAISYFNTKGQLTNQVDPDGIPTLYAYNAKGELEYTAVDVNANGAIDFGGTDRVTQTVSDVITNSALAAAVQRTRSFVWGTEDSNTSNLVSIVETSVDGLKSWSTVWNGSSAITNKTVIVYDPANGYRYVTNTAPDSSYSVAITRYGTNVSQTAFDSLNSQLSTINYTYDSHGRPNRLTDARTGTYTYFFNNADQVSGTATPAPSASEASQVTTNYFDVMGRVSKTVLPDGGVVTNDFSLAGQAQTISGARTYTSGNGYDVQGRFKSLTNWSGFPSTGARSTTWYYDPYRGWLTGKSYPDGAGPGYTYTDAGRLKTRLWARGTNAAYGYNFAGDLNSSFYSDATPGMTNKFDRLGRTISVTNGTSICSYTFNDAGLLLSDSNSAGVLSGLSVTNGYDQFLRRTNLTLNTQLSTINSTYGYDNASRLSSIRDGTNSATYSYLANSPLVGQIFYTNGGTLRMSRSNQFDNLNRLTSLVWTVGGTVVASFVQQFNDANQKTRVTLADGSYWLYQYDTLGQVASSKKYWNEGTPVPGQQATYDFDDIGNREIVASGGDQFGLNLRSATYGANLLNQYTNRTVPGYVDVQGSATNTATVTVNNQTTYRRSDYFRAELTATNASASLWFGATNLAVMNNGTNADIIASTTGFVFVAQSPEAFSYDLDGNLTNDGRWAISWDAENRATSFTRISSAPSGSKAKVDCTYDYRWRRTQKIVSAWNGSAYVAQSTNKFVYDGWNLMTILDATNGLVQSFTWGLDASGSLQGAGGVGGLISMTVHQGTNAGTYFYCFDGNHNVATLVNATNGAIAAQYEFDAFGNPLRASGPLAFINPFTFSAKFCDWETGFYYYGYRYHDPSTGRWLNRDLVQEIGGLNLYSFAMNNPLYFSDYLGLAWYDWPADLSQWANTHITAAQDALANQLGYLSVPINNSLSAINIVAQVPNLIANLGTGTGTSGWYIDEPILQPLVNLGYGTGIWWENKNLENFVGVAEDVSTTAGMVGGGIKGLPSFKSSPPTAPLRCPEKFLEGAVPAQLQIQKLLQGQKISLNQLKDIVPNNVPNIFKPSPSIEFGQKYQFEINGVKVEVKFHSPDAHAALKYKNQNPPSNSGTKWTAQIKVGDEFLGSDGKFYQKQMGNLTHIPIIGLP